MMTTKSTSSAVTRTKQKNPFSAIEKAVLNVGVGKLRNNAQFEEKLLPEIMQELAVIAGQKPAPRKTKKAIAGFKTRLGDVVGLKVTLRGKRMQDFLTRVIHVALPRVKDFRGIDLKHIDASGNLNLGLREQFVFPEIPIEKSKVNFGIQITVVPRLKKRSEAIDFYRTIGVPLKKS